MSELRELYQQLIIDHGRHPRNFGCLDDANLTKEGYNPLCGDRLTLYVLEENGVIKDIKFDGEGCAISMASASLMSGSIKGRSILEINSFFEEFHKLVTGEGKPSLDSDLGKLAVLGGVAEYPSRVKCATLCWHTLIAALQDNDEVVSTE